MTSEPTNILVIHFGQLGDVVLGLSAMEAIVERFPNARKTALVGKAASAIIEYTQLFDEVIPLDRVRLLEANKLSAIAEILRFTYSIRRRRFDMVIDLHSLPETNLLGFLSGASTRLFSNRESRSLDWLSNIKPRPPLEDKSIAVTDLYLAALAPIGISPKRNYYRLPPAADNVAKPRPLVGLNPGAGHDSRRWPLEKFHELAEKLWSSGLCDIVILLGPEEAPLARSVEATAEGRWRVFVGRSLVDLIETLSAIDIFVSNDTGPMHIAAALGVPVVLLIQGAAPERFLPLGADLKIHRGKEMADIETEDVLRSVKERLNR